MKTKQATLLFALVLLLSILVGCVSDRDIVIDATSNIFKCENGTTMFFGSLGQYYVEGNGCDGTGSKKDYAYRGTSGSPLVFRWKAIKFVPGGEGVTESRRYFYAESYETIELPQRSSQHERYEVHLSLGPRLVRSKVAIPDPAPVISPLDWGGNVTVYQVGDVDTLYYLVRSRPRDGRLPSVEQWPYQFHAIKGIELSEAQYLTIACEMSETGQCDAFLREDAPGLNDKQQAYLQAVRTEGALSQ